MMNIGEMNNILSVLDTFELFDADDVAMQIAEDFRRRRIEKNLSRRQIADKSGVSISNITRFEQKGLISLRHLISIAKSLGYASELKTLFSKPKYSTIEELAQIRRNGDKKRAYGRRDEN